jgi:hypothetical protein
MQASTTDATLVAYQDPAGTTQAYMLSSFSKGQLYFTGQNSATGVDTGGYGSFDVLQVQIGAQTPSGACSWGATLTTSSGMFLDSESNAGSLSSGNNSVTLSFSGANIA